jgi:SAM-dependent methyltransferase
VAALEAMRTIGELDAKYYPHYVKPDARLDSAIRRYLRPGHAVLDAGAGTGEAFRYDYKHWVRHVAGVDLEEGVLENPNLDEAHVADLSNLPFGDASFDLVLSRSVFEHFDDPVPVLKELRRVLRPGGHLVFRTPNRFHYFAIAASLTPHRFHQWFNEKRGFAADDTFPTRYRANDRFKLRKLAQATGYEVRELELFEIKPAYLFFHPIAYRAGIAYERLVHRFDALKDLRSVIIGVFEATPPHPSGHSRPM